MSYTVIVNSYYGRQAITENAANLLVTVGREQWECQAVVQNYWQKQQISENSPELFWPVLSNGLSGDFVYPPMCESEVSIFCLCCSFVMYLFQKPPQPLFPNSHLPTLSPVSEYLITIYILYCTCKVYSVWQTWYTHIRAYSGLPTFFHSKQPNNQSFALWVRITVTSNNPAACWEWSLCDIF